MPKLFNLLINDVLINKKDNYLKLLCLINNLILL